MKLLITIFLTANMILGIVFTHAGTSFTPITINGQVVQPPVKRGEKVNTDSVITPKTKPPQKKQENNEPECPKGYIRNDTIALNNKNGNKDKKPLSVNTKDKKCFVKKDKGGEILKQFCCVRIGSLISIDSKGKVCKKGVVSWKDTKGNKVAQCKEDIQNPEMGGSKARRMQSELIGDRYEKKALDEYAKEKVKDKNQSRIWDDKDVVDSKYHTEYMMVKKKDGSEHYYSNWTGKKIVERTPGGEVYSIDPQGKRVRFSLKDIRGANKSVELASTQGRYAALRSAYIGDDVENHTKNDGSMSNTRAGDVSWYKYIRFRDKGAEVYKVEGTTESLDKRTGMYIVRDDKVPIETYKSVLDVVDERAQQYPEAFFQNKKYPTTQLLKIHPYNETVLGSHSGEGIILYPEGRSDEQIASTYHHEEDHRAEYGTYQGRNYTKDFLPEDVYQFDERKYEQVRAQGVEGISLGDYPDSRAYATLKGEYYPVMAQDRFAGRASSNREFSNIYNKNLQTFDNRYKNAYSGGAMDQYYWDNITPTTYYNGKDSYEYQESIFGKIKTFVSGWFE